MTVIMKKNRSAVRKENINVLISKEVEDVKKM